MCKLVSKIPSDFRATSALSLSVYVQAQCQRDKEDAVDGWTAMPSEGIKMLFEMDR